jgi:DNA polymerase/3'-5' exonuclease PolX
VSELALGTAERYAHQILGWLEPYYKSAYVVGSIRRQRPIVNDIDIVCIPRMVEAEGEADLFGAKQVMVNSCYRYLVNYVENEKKATWRLHLPALNCKQMLITLAKCELDLWFADESTLATRMMCRTGSMEHNVWMCERATRMGKHWDPYLGLKQPDGSIEVASTEEELYAQFGLPFIDPTLRELSYLTKTYGA